MDGLRERAHGAYKVARGAAEKFSAENGPLIAAAISFYALLSLIPLLLHAVAVFGFVIGSSERAFEEVSVFFSQFVPSPGFVTSTLEDLVDARGVIGWVGILTLLWTGSQFFVILQKGLNDIWEVTDKVGFLEGRIKAVILVMVFGAFLVLSIGSTSLASLVQSAAITPDSGALATLFSIGAVLLGLVFSIGMFMVVYRFVPDRSVSSHAALLGAVFAGLVWTVAKELYRVYLTYADFGQVYGSLGSVVILILWIYYSSVITVFGGEIAYVNEHGPQEVAEEKQRMSD